MNHNEQASRAEKIRYQYTHIEKEATKFDALVELDEKVKLPANLFAYFFGSVGALIMGGGMSLIMTDIGGALGIEYTMLPGIVLGIIGMLMAAVNYPIYNSILSACYTSANVHDVGSEEYFDKMIEWGAKFCWLFTYMPVGKAAVPELMVSAEQRKFMYEQVRKFRETKPIFTMDFWNDGEYSRYKTSFGEEYPGGCIAGGRRYLHINANGDIEPCAFIHYSDSNIREKSLLDALRSSLFMGYHRNQPFNDNMLRPCPVLDNPGALTRLVEESGAKSTDYQTQESAKEYSDKCVEKAAAWADVADELWRCSGHCEGCAGKETR